MKTAPASAVGSDRYWKAIAPPGRPLRWLLPFCLLAAVLAAQYFAPTWARRPEAWSEDLRFELRGPRSPQSPLVIVALDEASFQMMGDLNGENIRTWPRQRWAELVNKIAQSQPLLIALDVVFDTPGWDAGGDQALAQALAQSGNCILASHLETHTTNPAQPNSYQSLTYSPPVAQLSQAALGAGVANYTLDADGGIRAAQLLWSWGGQTLPGFPLLVASAARGAPVQMDKRDLGENLDLAINYRGPEGSYPTYSMIQVWNNELPPESLQGKLVLVGFTTFLEMDRHTAPFSGRTGLPGVEIHATVIDNLLNGDWLRRPPSWLGLLLVGAAALIALAAANLPRPLLSVIVLLGAGVIYSAVGVLLFTQSNYILPLASPAIAALSVGGAALAERMIFAEQDKRRLRQRFAGMMSPERLQAVMDHWDELRHEARPPKYAAVMFADVRNFTHATETLMRQDRNPAMVRFLNAYLDAMSQVVFQEGGVIYRVIGDGLLIMFGIPEALPDCALHAARCAVGMAQAARQLQEDWPLRDELPLGLGIGVHCGQLVDAIVGSGRRVDYVIIGDAANTAARIEAYCKEAAQIPIPESCSLPERIPDSVTILISEDVYQAVRETAWVDDSIPPYQARGKTQPLRVYRLLGFQKGASP